MTSFGEWMEAFFDFDASEHSVICKRCGLRDIWSLTVHAVNVHGDDVSDVEVRRPPRLHLCDARGVRIPHTHETLAELVSTAAAIRRDQTVILERLAIMTADQSHLDADVQSLGAAEAELVQVISDLKAQAAASQPLDFTAADALVAKVQGDASAAEPPAQPAEPSAPVDVPPADAPVTEVPASDVPAPVDTPPTDAPVNVGPTELPPVADAPPADQPSATHDA